MGTHLAGFTWDVACGGIVVAAGASVPNGEHFPGYPTTYTYSITSVSIDDQPYIDGYRFDWEARIGDVEAGRLVYQTGGDTFTWTPSFVSPTIYVCIWGMDYYPLEHVWRHSDFAKAVLDPPDGLGNRSVLPCRQKRVQLLC